jgi:hypothetical protein
VETRGLFPTNQHFPLIAANPKLHQPSPVFIMLPQHGQRQEALLLMIPVILDVIS